MIEVTGGHILTLIGLIVSAASILIAVIWSQLTHRIKSGEENHGELKEDAANERQKQSDTAQRIFDKIEAGNQVQSQAQNETTRALGDLKTAIAQNMVTKADCADARAAMRAKPS